MNTILFFDTETTGLPNFKKPLSCPTQPKLLQLGCILATEEMDILEKVATLVQIGSTSIHPMAYKAHKISAERANKEGCPAEEAFAIFYEMAMAADYLVCHNHSFDIKIIELNSAQIKEAFPDPEIPEVMMSEINDLPSKCTMKSTINFCKLPFPSGRKGFKFPKLEELHRILFGEDFIGAHDAMADVSATMRCYFKLREMGVM